MSRAQAGDGAGRLRSYDRLALLSGSPANVSDEAGHADVARTADRQRQSHCLIAADVAGPFHVSVGVVFHHEGVIGIVWRSLYGLAEAGHAQSIAISAGETGGCLEPTTHIDVVGRVNANPTRDAVRRSRVGLSPLEISGGVVPHQEHVPATDSGHHVSRTV